eukprot:5913362-Prymnesium_polylepis.2
MLRSGGSNWNVCATAEVFVRVTSVSVTSPSAVAASSTVGLERLRGGETPCPTQPILNVRLSVVRAMRVIVARVAASGEKMTLRSSVSPGRM